MRELDLDLRCNVNEKAFSWTLFLTRVIASIVLFYNVAGCVLHYRDFVYNAAALGFPMPLQLATASLAVTFIAALCLALGWFTRLASGICFLGTVAVGAIFFAGELNRIYVALAVLLMGTLLPSVLLGPGKISLDYRRAKRRAEKELRG